MDVTALNAANTLAQQRMTMFKEDNATASKVTKKPVTKGKGDGATQALVLGLNIDSLYALP